MTQTSNHLQCHQNVWLKHQNTFNTIKLFTQSICQKPFDQKLCSSRRRTDVRYFTYSAYVMHSLTPSFQRLHVQTKTIKHRWRKESLTNTAFLCRQAFQTIQAATPTGRRRKTLSWMERQAKGGKQTAALRTASADNLGRLYANNFHFGGNSRNDIYGRLLQMFLSEAPGCHAVICYSLRLLHLTDVLFSL